MHKSQTFEIFDAKNSFFLLCVISRVPDSNQGRNKNYKDSELLNFIQYYFKGEGGITKS